jgi:hypothetical protein
VTYIIDLTFISELLNVVVIPAAAIFAVKIKQYKPQIEDAISQKDEAVSIAEDIYAKSKTVIPLFQKLRKLTDDYTRAIANDGAISEEETQALLADAGLIAKDPAVQELIDVIEGYTCKQ